MNEITWSWILIRASGVTAWALLTAVIMWGLFLRTRLLGAKTQPVALLHMHRWLGSLALGALVIHLVALFVDPVVGFTIPQLLIPGIAPWQPFAVTLGTLALWCMLPVSLVGRIRTKLGKKGNALFSRSHLVAYCAWPLATAHYILAGTDALAEWSIALLLAGSVMIVFLLLARGYVQPPTRKARSNESPPKPALAGDRLTATAHRAHTQSFAKASG